MKVNFNAAYRDVIKIVNARTLTVEKPSPTAERPAISSITNKATQQSEIISKPDTFQTLLGTKVDRDELNLMSNESVRARYDFPKPSLSIPELEPLTPESVGILEKDVNVSTQMIQKSLPPQIVGIRRLKEFEEGREIKAETADKNIEARVKGMLHELGKDIGIDPLLGLAVIKAESSFNPTAVSTDGHNSKGLFQLLDRTARDVVKREQIDSYSPFDPESNVEVGANYLGHLHEIFSEPTKLPNGLSTIPAANSSALEKLAVAAFNAGEGRVASAQYQARDDGNNPSIYEEVEGYLPESTQEYVKRVMKFRGAFLEPEEE